MTVFWLIVVFCNGLCLWQREVFWWEVRTILISDYKYKYLIHRFGLWWFSKVVVVGSFLRPITSLVLGTWLGFQNQAWFPSFQQILSPIREQWVITKVCVPLLSPWGFHVVLIAAVVLGIIARLEMLLSVILELFIHSLGPLRFVYPCLQIKYSF